MKLSVWSAALVLSLLLSPSVQAARPDEIVTFDDGLQAAAFFPPGYGRDGAGQKWPTILFSHGFGGSALSQNELLRKLSGLGVLALAVEHNDPVTLKRIPPKKRDSNWQFFQFLRHHPFTEKTYGYRPPEFDHFVRDAIARFPVDTHKVIFAGHSMGGYTIFNAVKSSPVKPIALIAYSTGEETYKTGRQYFTSGQLAGLRMPLLITYGEKEPDAKKGPYADQIRRYYGGPSEEMMIKGGGHLSYVDAERWWKQKKRHELIQAVFVRTRSWLAEVLNDPGIATR